MGTEMAYVVVELSWEDVGGCYTPPKCGGGFPRKIFLSKAKAEAEKDQRNRLERLSYLAPHTFTLDEKGDRQFATEFYQVVEVEIAR